MCFPSLFTLIMVQLFFFASSYSRGFEETGDPCEPPASSHRPRPDAAYSLFDLWD